MDIERLDVDFDSEKLVDSGVDMHTGTRDAKRDTRQKRNYRKKKLRVSEVVQRNVIYKGEKFYARSYNGSLLLSPRYVTLYKGYRGGISVEGPNDILIPSIVKKEERRRWFRENYIERDRSLPIRQRSFLKRIDEDKGLWKVITS